MKHQFHPKKRLYSFISILLVFTVLCCMIPSPALASSSPYTDALQKANSLKQIIISDVPECTWTENTVCANTFPLYDIDLNVNGYVFEFETNGSPSGFIQIDLSTGEARLDSYCFSGVHTSNIMKQGKKNLSSNAKTIYLGGYSYLTEQPSAPFSLTKSYMDLYTGETLSLDTQIKAEIRESYNQYVANKVSTNRASAPIQPLGTNTVTKFVSGYTTAIAFETYTSVGDTVNKNTCAPIAVTNICKYWDLCKGKSALYTAGNTYTTLKNAMGPYVTGGCNPIKTESAWKNYVSSKGYTPYAYSFSREEDEREIAFSTYREFIDWNRPFLYHTFWPKLGKDDITGAPIILYSSHAVAAFGYQYIEVENTIIVADAYSATCVYKTWSSLGHGNDKWGSDEQICSCVIPF